MNLYQHQRANIRKTFFLFFLFFVFIIFVGFIFSYIYNDFLFLWLAFVFAFFSSFLSYWYSDKLVIYLTKAKPLRKEDNRGLYNIVENLCITAGLPMPRIYIVEENQPNAFATGRSPKKAVVAVTRGLLEKLERSELEGVIAHELAHVANRDTLISTIAVVLVGFIAILADFFLRTYFWFGNFRDRDRRSGGQIELIVIILGIMLAILAPLGATLLRLAISRKREFLADASGALLTRYPEGLARALEKISSDSTPLKVANNATSHLWIEDPFKKKSKTSFWYKLFMTHPPVEERISALRGMKV